MEIKCKWKKSDMRRHKNEEDERRTGKENP